MHHPGVSFRPRRQQPGAGIVLALCGLLFAGPVLGQSAPQQTGRPQTGGASVLERVDNALNAQNSLVRSMVSECVIASVAAIVVTVSMTTPVSPVAAAALSASPGMSLPTIGVLGCAAAAVGGAASAGVAYAWQDREVLADAVATPIVTAWNVIAGAEEWSLASLLSRGTEGVVTAIGDRTSGLLALFQVSPAPVPIRVAELRANQPMTQAIYVSGSRGGPPPTRWPVMLTHEQP